MYLDISLTIQNCHCFYLQWLSDEEALKERDHHGDKPAYGAVFPISQSIHHSEIP